MVRFCGVGGSATASMPRMIVSFLADCKNYVVLISSQVIPDVLHNDDGGRFAEGIPLLQLIVRGNTVRPHISQNSESQCVTIVPICATSKFEPLIVFSVLSSSSFQRGSGAPLKYQFDPLSATIIPYFLKARRITCIAGENPEILNDAFRRTRMPIGGKLGLFVLLG